VKTLRRRTFSTLIGFLIETYLIQLQRINYYLKIYP
jgi:hypothetical protein